MRSIYTNIDLEQRLVDTLRLVSKRFAFIHLFYIEFEKVLQFVQMVSSSTAGHSSQAPPPSQTSARTSEYFKSLKVLAWLIYITNRGEDNLLPNNANMMLSSMSYILRLSARELTIEFTISERGEKAVIPGESKIHLQDQILEYLCKLMHFNCDEETHAIKERFNAKIEGLFLKEFGLDRETVVQNISDKKKVGVVIQILQGYYKNNLGFDAIDESIFVRESRVGFVYWFLFDCLLVCFKVFCLRN